MRYAVTLVPDDNGTLLVTAPDIPEAVTFGEDREDALARAADAIETAIMGFISAREDIPAPKVKGQDYVSLPALSVAKIELYRAMRADGVGKAALAKRLGVALPQIDRPRPSPRFPPRCN
jgi:antitoxin HicB